MSAKRQTGAQDKRRVPEKNKVAEGNGTPKMAELSAQVQEALALLDTETADQIIGEQRPEYQTLIQAAQAIMAMNWSAMKSCGVRQNQESLRYSAQTSVVVLDLVHKAYALGIREGRGDG